MSQPPPWVTDENASLLTDLYQLTMLQAYWSENLDGRAVFSLYFRQLPPGRNYLLACGLDSALRYLEHLQFGPPEIEYLRSSALFSEDFLEWLGRLRFNGEVYAVPEGTPVFPQEPILEVSAEIAQAQLVESFLMNQVHLETVLASKAARVVTAAQGRPVLDFALRRAHGADAALKGARAFYIAGVDATSNVLAGCVYGIPTAGTMAHSYVQAHDLELEAFRRFARLYPETTLLVDSYDALEGVRKVVELARELGDEFSVRGIRIDSGDLATLAARAREILDAAALESVAIYASGLLDEHEIARLVRDGAPIAGFGVGTRMGVSADAPSADMAYKLTDYAGIGRLKLSPDKDSLPGPKQVFRIEANGRALRDVLARRDEPGPGRPLLRPVMRDGVRTPESRDTLAAAQARSRGEIAKLPEPIRGLDLADPPYVVELSDALREERERAIARLGPGTASG